MAISSVVVQITLVVVSFTVLFTAQVEGAPKNCVKDYEKAFGVLLSIKESCNETALKDCCQIAEGAQLFGAKEESGVYNIADVCSHVEQPFLKHDQCISVFRARCDMKSDNAGWMVILRRKASVSPLINFDRTWEEYKQGFGDLNTEFWYGLNNIHCLTQRDDMELMIELKNNDGSGITWTYQTFRVDGPETNYVLHIGGAERIEGTGSNHMAYHNGYPFSTIGRDNDAASSQCVATYGGGGWWYKNCYEAALTLPHTGNRNHKISWSGTYFPHVEMKIRPKNCQV